MSISFATDPKNKVRIKDLNFTITLSLLFQMLTKTLQLQLLLIRFPILFEFSTVVSDFICYNFCGLKNPSVICKIHKNLELNTKIAFFRTENFKK